MLQACFTGVESTPKITAKELKKQKVVETAESHLLDHITVSTPPAEWTVGKRFYIADNRAARGAWRVEPFDMADSIAGRYAVVTAIDTVPSLTERPEVQIAMKVESLGASQPVILEFKTGMDRSRWQTAPNFTLPHLIDMDMVDAVASELVGKTFYILPARRYGADGIDTIGTRYQPVIVRRVEPASEATPLRVVFTDDEGHTASVLMTVGDATTSRRNFETIFAIESPRKRYKNIDDETWELIRHSRVAPGMTPDECRLALGSPDSYSRIPTTGGMVERWTYRGGVYLLFEDGVLASFRQ